VTLSAVHGALSRSSDWVASSLRGWKREQEGTMFQMINEEKHTAEDRKMMWVKVAIFIVGIGVLGGVVYFFAFVPFGK
jgi:hypothetical protein